MLETMHCPRRMLSRTHYFAATIAAAAAAANEDHRRPDECMYRSDYSPPTAWLDDIQKSGGNEMTSLHDTRLWPTAETALLLLLAPWLIIGDSGRPQHIFLWRPYFHVANIWRENDLVTRLTIHCSSTWRLNHEILSTSYSFTLHSLKLTLQHADMQICITYDKLQVTIHLNCTTPTPKTLIGIDQQPSALSPSAQSQ